MHLYIQKGILILNWTNSFHFWSKAKGVQINVEKWKIKSILSPKVHLARFYGIFKEVAYFCMRPIDNYLSALDGFLSSKGFLTKLKQCVAATHFLRLGRERWSEVKFLWENNAMTGPGL